MLHTMYCQELWLSASCAIVMKTQPIFTNYVPSHGAHTKPLADVKILSKDHSHQRPLQSIALAADDHCEDLEQADG